MKALLWDETLCKDIETLFENLRRKKEDELQRLLLILRRAKEKSNARNSRTLEES